MQSTFLRTSGILVNSAWSFTGNEHRRIVNQFCVPENFPRSR